jgi:hypothetical protein
VQYTFWMLGDWEKAMLYDEEHMRYVLHYTLPMVGREAEAIARYRELEASRLPGLEHFVCASARAALEGKRDECVAAARILLDSSFHDPEGLMYLARSLARAGEPVLALETLERVVAGGLYCTSVLERDPWLAPLRTDSRFAGLLEGARAGRRRAAETYRRAGGETLLGAAVD